MRKKTIVLGASQNPQRYSYMAVKKLDAYQHLVIAVGKRAGNINGIDIITDQPLHNDIDTVTLYLNPVNQKPYYDYILALHPKRIIFNPGTENNELQELAESKGIETLEACTLVMLSTGQY
ncbi:MAG: CoA-binding protein [Ferruginibacter sp.]